MSAASDSGALGTAARRLNFYQPEMRSLLMRTSRNLPDATPTAWKPILIRIDPRWGDHETWRLLQRGVQALTPDYLLSALDRRVDSHGSIASVPSDVAVYVAAVRSHCLDQHAGYFAVRRVGISGSVATGNAAAEAG